MVDFHTPGGVDCEGWQYAVDFPASYHAKKQFTDYVRRRRWYKMISLTRIYLGINFKCVDPFPPNQVQKVSLVNHWPVEGDRQHENR